MADGNGDDADAGWREESVGLAGCISVGLSDYDLPDSQCQGPLAGSLERSVGVVFAALVENECLEFHRHHLSWQATKLFRDNDAVETLRWSVSASLNAF